MGPLDLTDHLLSFVAPAIAVAFGVALAARLLRLDRRPAGRLWVTFALDSIAGIAALAGSLAYFGHDGKVAAYALLVLAVATMQWLAGRAWNR
jgi:hypothetical protein